jgi:hypothetical protein
VGNEAPELEKGFALTNNMLGGYTIAFRKEVWEEVGGWDDRCSTAQSDNVFLIKIWKAGYWKGILSGARRLELEQFERPDTYVHTAGVSVYDRSLPKIFGLNDLHEINVRRAELSRQWDDTQKQIPAGLENLDYWFKYFFDIFSAKFDNIFETENVTYDVSRVNWDIAERHGQAKWKDAILGDFT